MYKLIIAYMFLVIYVVSAVYIAANYLPENNSIEPAIAEKAELPGCKIYPIDYFCK